VSIKAKYRGLCHICDKPWAVGDHIGRWLGREAHFSCRQELIALRAAEGDVTQEPEARGWADNPNWTKPRRGTRRYVDIGRISTQDGRSQDGRFQSKPDPL